LKIAVFGPGGTGKTTLGHFFAGTLNAQVDGSLYRTSLGIENYTLQGDLVCSLLVPPGQERFRLDWTNLFRLLSAGKAGGVINVASYGYHSFEGLSYRNITLPGVNTSGTIAEFVTSYTENRRQYELDYLRLLAPRLMDADSDIWMITLVTKQDLWWKHAADVQAFYMHGEYNEIIRDITNQRGANNFTHHYLSASLVISNLISGTGELLIPNAEGYDQHVQARHLANLLNSVTTFAGR
jgi:GTPase SAR1 family protein